MKARGKIAIAGFLVPPILVAIPTCADLLKTILAIGWFLIAVPFAIVVAIDWFRSAEPRGRMQVILQAAVRIPVFLLGLLAILIGMCVLGWIAYNLAWERLPGFRGQNVGRGIVLYVAMIGFGFSMIRLSFRSAPKLKHERETVDGGPGAVT